MSLDSVVAPDIRNSFWRVCDRSDPIIFFGLDGHAAFQMSREEFTEYLVSHGQEHPSLSLVDTDASLPDLHELFQSVRDGEVASRFVKFPSCNGIYFLWGSLLDGCARGIAVNIEQDVNLTEMLEAYAFKSEMYSLVSYISRAMGNVITTISNVSHSIPLPEGFDREQNILSSQIEVGREILSRSNDFMTSIENRSVFEFSKIEWWKIEGIIRGKFDLSDVLTRFAAPAEAVLGCTMRRHLVVSGVSAMILIAKEALKLSADEEKPGSIEVHVDVREVSRGVLGTTERVCFSVSHTGDGISKTDALEKFSEFNFMNDLIEAHGGEIAFVSDGNSGCRMEMLLHKL